MNRMREKYVEEMDRLEKAITQTESKYLKKDYAKALYKMKIELRDYDKFKKAELLNGNLTE